ncbi:MAG: NADPH-dependent FMN reductase, partial [Actinomycetes bacterium]
TALIRAAAQLAPPGVQVVPYTGLRELPHYDADLDGEAAPKPVVDLRERIERADALLIASPEYNYSIPGALKNAIDWASRPAMTSVLRHKPVAVIGAATGGFGGVRAQLALRQVWLWTRSIPVSWPEVLVSHAASRFDDAGNLTDETSRGLLGELLESVRGAVERERRQLDAVSR